ncbi:phosphotransferase [Streptomyces sp. NPDC048717]|uniref:phosphotransferase n=1 Tax=Streptomyces sp. NPDC048717 TaxID=3154928 RepID=UPI003420DD28
MRRVEFDEQAYAHRSRTGPCFICRMLAGDPEFRHEIVYLDEHHVVFLDRYPTLLGKLLVAPVQHREDVIGDFTEETSTALWQVVHRAGAALEKTVPTERIYVLSLGSKSGNSHVHIHVAALPPGVPYDRQQTAALLWESAGLLEVPTEETARIAGRLRAALAPGADRLHMGLSAGAAADMPDRRVREFAETVVGRVSVWTDVSGARTGSRVWHARGTEGGEWFVKVHRSDRFHAREVTAYRTWVPTLGAAVPRLVAADAGLRAVVLTAVRGRSLHGAVHPPGQQRQIFRHIGRLAASIHRSAPPRPGAGTLWLGKLERHLDGARAHLVAGDEEFIRAITGTAAALPAPEAVPTHGDFQLRNLRWDESADILYVIDFERSEEGPALRDFVRLSDAWHGRPDLFQAVMDGYGRPLTPEEENQLTVLSVLDAVSGISYGAAHGDPELVERGLRTLARLRTAQRP